MSNETYTYRGRLLPTYRWDDWDKDNSNPHQLSELEGKLLVSTANVLHDYIQESGLAGLHILPPASVISPIIAMNIAKRTSATYKAEDLVEKGEISRPPTSLIPTFMNSGHEIPGVEDRYMHADHPSQELFAYNRLGKKSWLNQRFGAHCLKAIGFAHPNGHVEASDGHTRVKAHVLGPDADTASDGWVIVSSKTPIASISENGRRASLISRVTGAVDIRSPWLYQDEVTAIEELSRHDRLTDEQPLSVVMAQKALLLGALNRHDGSPDSAFHPVIQTVYLTQQTQK